MKNYTRLKEIIDELLENEAMSEKVRAVFIEIRSEISETQTWEQRIGTFSKYAKALMDVAHIIDKLSDFL